MTEKVSLTLDQALLAEARERVGRRGLSRYVNEALEMWLQRERILGMLEEMDRRSGPVPPEVMEQVRREWHGAGRRHKRRSA